MSETIYLEKDEEITTIIDRVRKAQSHEVSLVLPKGSALLQSIVNLKLLKKESDKLGKIVSVVTTDKTGKNLAAKAGLLVHGDIQSSQKSIPLFGSKSEFDEDELRVFDTAQSEQEPEKPKLQKESSNFLKKLPPAREKQEKPLTSENKSEPKTAPQSPSGPSQPKTAPKKSMIDIVIHRIKDVEKSETQPPKTSVSQPSPKKKKPKKKINLFSKSQKVKQPKTEKSKKISLIPPLGRKIILISVAAVAAIALLVSFVVLPRAELTVKPKTEDYSEKIDVIVSTEIESIDLANNAVPGELIEESSKLDKEFQATGEKEIGEKASGTIELFNSYSSDPQPLVASTRFVAEDGKLFRSTEPVTIPGASVQDGETVPGTASVNVQADQVGPDYNIGPSRFTIPGLPPDKQDDIYGQSESAMSGGQSEKVRIVSREDLDNAKTVLTDELSKDLKAKLSKKSPSNKKTLEDIFDLQITAESASAAEGDQTDNFTFSIEGTARTIAFDEDAVFSTALDQIAEDLGSEKHLISEENDGLSYQLGAPDFDSNRVILTVQAEKTVAFSFDEADLTSQSVGKTEQDINQSAGNFENITEIKASFWPFWVKKAPRQAEKIKIKIDPGEN